MTVLADAYVMDALDRLRRDIRTTGLGTNTRFVEERALEIAAFVDEPKWFVHKVVDDVQQRFQDEFIDTTWPACPMHRNHPLDYSEGAWHCPRTHDALARLGELPR